MSDTVIGQLPPSRFGYLLVILFLTSLSVAHADATPTGWWWQTLDGSPHHIPDTTIAWHGRIMVAAWSICIPAGILVARFYKVTPWQRFPQQLDNQFWWITHQVLQYLGVLATLFAAWLVTGHTSDSTTVSGRAHSVAGWALCVLCVAQVIGAWLRGSKGGPDNINAWPDSPVKRGDHYDRTRRRLIFEQIHIVLGYTTLGLAFVTTTLGLYESEAPRWMWVTLVLWWSLVILRFLQLQRRNTHIQTYQAIWGQAREHPGNQIRN